MPGFLLHLNAGMQCFHLAKATVVPTQARVLVNGQPITTISTPATPIAAVAGCPFVIPVPPPPATKPQPCVTVKWTMPSARFVLGGLPAALVPAPGPGPGICQSAEQIPQGAPIVSAVQNRVIGS
jgi:hypothetical protein